LPLLGLPANAILIFVDPPLIKRLYLQTDHSAMSYLMLTDG